MCIKPITYTVYQKNVRYLISHNLKKREPIFILFGTQYPDNLGF